MTVISLMTEDGTQELALRTVPVVVDAKGPVGLLVELDRHDGQQLHEQLEHRVRDAIRDGRLAAGARLPSSRGLAAELGISRGVVTSAYEQLAAEGYLETKQGAPVRVAQGVRAHPPRPPTLSLEPKLAYDFTPASRTSPDSRAIVGCARYAPLGARRRSTLSATATHGACPSSASRSPTTLGASAGRLPTPST